VVLDGGSVVTVGLGLSSTEVIVEPVVVFEMLLRNAYAGAGGVNVVPLLTQLPPAVPDGGDPATFVKVEAPGLP
jgi:hypothetical protein